MAGWVASLLNTQTLASYRPGVRPVVSKSSVTGSLPSGTVVPDAGETASHGIVAGVSQAEATEPNTWNGAPCAGVPVPLSLFAFHVDEVWMNTRLLPVIA